MSELYPITWVSGVLNDHKCWLGFCGKTRMLYHIAADEITPLVVNDLIIDSDGECEEAKGCLHLECPLNRTTPASYWKRHGLPGPPPSRWATFSNLELPDDIEGKGGMTTGKDYGPMLALNLEEVHQDE